MELSHSEENYLKAIYSLSAMSDTGDAATNEIADRVQTKPPSVVDMLKKLATKKLVTYEKYKRVQLTSQGKKVAIQVVRKHRLWETFLFEKLQFNWDEVHEVAEQLEHIHSEKLIERLDQFLGHPVYDPHGDPIPSANGEIKTAKRYKLSEIEAGTTCQVVGVNDSSSDFLMYLQQLSVGIGTKIKVLERIAFDHSLMVSFKKGHQTVVSKKFADNVLVT
ncbi:metal-dependent transcriptional regulator [Paraflavitalea sp. CAU 1676]|uniref:metal-dependent transcriptional regulator n=1 Tax=Paraflavitalea sp. CAU 1676 TaxID=3032598 RepID=UPI0023DA2B71|nr:metal-dependent transcriptional regulator [Paraflavitalea sp. CAU 1676]MDF2191353.1 metal-dependent transcriptional regulator [Paraflavitalea sp. CAU 1676]